MTDAETRLSCPATTDATGSGPQICRRCAHSRLVRALTSVFTSDLVRVRCFSQQFFNHVFGSVNVALLKRMQRFLSLHTLRSARGL